MGCRGQKKEVKDETIALLLDPLDQHNPGSGVAGGEGGCVGEQAGGEEGGVRVEMAGGPVGKPIDALGTSRRRAVGGWMGGWLGC